MECCWLQTMVSSGINRSRVYCTVVLLLCCCTVVVLLYCFLGQEIFRGLEVGWSCMGPWDTSKFYAPVWNARGLEVGCSRMGPWDTSKFYAPVKSTRPVPLVWSSLTPIWSNIGFIFLILVCNCPVWGLLHISAKQGSPDGEGEHNYCSKKFLGF